MRTSIAVLVLGFMVACGGSGNGGGGDDQPGVDGGIGGHDGGHDGPGTPDGPPNNAASCDAQYLGAGDGCDCGCGVVDPDCGPTVTIDECSFDNCGTGHHADPTNPTLCIATQVPAGWTCDTSSYGGDCTCGCGATDDLGCPATPDILACATTNGCSSGTWPDPADPAKCVPIKAGWTCSEAAYYDNKCDCGCGIADPSCPAHPTVSQCTDACPSGKSFDPAHPTQCIANAPQDHWTCGVDLIGDGKCDCGCGAIDTDCPANPTPASCTVNHCGSMMELKPGDIGKCWETCSGTEPAGAGNATCTNDAYISILGSCSLEGSACSDGRRYKIECEGSECTCSINNTCVGHATAGGCLSLAGCGWDVDITSFP
ncbi:hypothetical protein BH11MYX2_BH11MYX2_09010 [soil metagenome]